MKKIIAVIGDGNIGDDKEKYRIAFETGKALVDAGYRVQCGGLGGVMEAACKGARSSKNHKDGDVIAILPSFDRTEVNEYADIAIPTGIDVMRNVIVANADAVIAVGGGAGTLSEMAHAWSLKRLIISYSSVEGWSKKLAGQRIDGKIRYNGIDDKVFEVKTPEEAIKVLNEKIGLYVANYKKIQYIK